MSDLKVIVAPKESRERSKGQAVLVGEACAKMKPGQAIPVTNQAWASQISRALMAYSGKPFRAMTGEDKKAYITLDHS